MDEITDNVGGLSLSAKEWRPGKGFASTTETGRQSSGDSARSGADWNKAPSSQAIDVNGTHYFGSAASTSWESSRQSHHPSMDRSDPEDNADATFPSQYLQQNRTLHRSTLSASLSPPMDEYHHYRELSLQSTREMDPNDPAHKAVPPSFCRAYCLDDRRDGDGAAGNSITQRRSSFGYPTSLFRVTSTADGNLYTLRRIDSVRCVSHKIAQSVMHQWLSSAFGRENHAAHGGFDHPGVVRWYKCFLSQRALFFVHQYHPGATTLRERFFGHGHGGGVPLPESLVWSCLVQLVSAVRAVHDNNLAVRTLQLNHILCTQEHIASSPSSSDPYGLPRLRLRINCIGIVDILEFEARRGLEELQGADMRALGCILLSMTTGVEINVIDIYGSNSGEQQARTLIEYFQFVQQNYSRDIYLLVQSLLNPSAPPSSIQVIAASMAMRAFDELDGAFGCIDEKHVALAGNFESGRAMRLLLKLAFVNERPEFGIDANWSESGDCYILKLFRDYVFHQADVGGRPVMDLSHVISSLNKLDAADEEKIVLVSRDGKNVMVVSFADVAWCLEKAYQELCSSSVPIPSMS